MARPPSWLVMREVRGPCPTPTAPGHAVPHVDVDVRVRLWHPGYWLARVAAAWIRRRG